MAAHTPPLGMADVVPMSTMGALFRQILERRVSDPDTDATVLGNLADNGLLGEWLGLLPAASLRESRWRDQLRAVQLGGVRLAATSTTVSGILDRAGVDHVVYKGVATPAMLGYTWNLRQSADVDVLATPDKITTAVTALREAQWVVHPGYHVPNRLRRWAYAELSLDGPGVSIDLHWRIDSSPQTLRIPTETLIRSSVDAPLGKAKVPTLNPEHSALMTAVHGSKELWWQGKWILDLARAVSMVDPGSLRRLAMESGSQRSLALGCAALYELAPDAVPEVLRPGPGMTELWKQASQRQPDSSITRRLLRTRTADSFTARLDGLGRTIVRQILPHGAHRVLLRPWPVG